MKPLKQLTPEKDHNTVQLMLPMFEKKMTLKKVRRNCWKSKREKNSKKNPLTQTVFFMILL